MQPPSPDIKAIGAKPLVTVANMGFARLPERAARRSRELRIKPPAPSRGSEDVANIFLESGTESHLPEKSLGFQDPKQERCWKSPDDSISFKHAASARTHACRPTGPARDRTCRASPNPSGDAAAAAGTRATSSPRGTSKQMDFFFFFSPPALWTFSAPLPPDSQDIPQAGSPESPLLPRHRTAAPRHGAAAWFPVTQPCSGDPTWADVGFPLN